MISRLHLDAQSAIYCTRRNAQTRSVANEAELLATLQATFPEEKVVVYDNIDDVPTLVNLFKRAKVIMGPHGAGLSHMLFSCSASITVWMPRSSSVYIAPATL